MAKVYFLNAPISFENDVLDDMKEDLPEGTIGKIRLSGTQSHPELDASVKPEVLATAWRDFDSKI